MMSTQSLFFKENICWINKSERFQEPLSNEAFDQQLSKRIYKNTQNNTTWGFGIYYE